MSYIVKNDRIFLNKVFKHLYAVLLNFEANIKVCLFYSTLWGKMDIKTVFVKHVALLLKSNSYSQKLFILPPRLKHCNENNLLKDRYFLVGFFAFVMKT